jgi:hypothetical protein
MPEDYSYNEVAIEDMVEGSERVYAEVSVRVGGGIELHVESGDGAEALIATPVLSVSEALALIRHLTEAVRISLEQ